MKKLNLFLLSIIFSLSITKLFTGENYAFGKARVVDGDTIVIKKERIRFGGINSPERKEVGYQLAKDKLIKKSKNILIKEGLRKAIEAVSIVKTDIFFIDYI